jgi:hypothetical protein
VRFIPIVFACPPKRHQRRQKPVWRLTSRETLLEVRWGHDRLDARYVGISYLKRHQGAVDLPISSRQCALPVVYRTSDRAADARHPGLEAPLMSVPTRARPRSPLRCHIA